MGTSQTSRRAHASSRSAACVVEAVERRVLMSGTVVDDFQMHPGQGAGFTDIVEDAAGNLYTAGQAKDADGVNHALVRKGERQTDGSVRWSEQAVIDYTLGANGSTSFKDMLIDPTTGDLYATGQAQDAAGGTWWVSLRRSAAGEVSVVDKYRYQPERSAYATGIAQDATGSIYVVGEAASVTTTTQGNKTTTTSDPRWIVRKLSSDGTRFETVHDFAEGNGARGIAPAPSGVYVVGRGDAGSWITQRGVVADAAGSLSWTTVDSYRADPAFNSSVINAGVDAAGNVYTLGRGNKGTGEKRRGVELSVGEWTVRRTSDAGASWDTIDSLQLSGSGYPCAFGADPAGNLYVAGHAEGADGRQHAVVRTAGPDGTNWTTLDEWQLVAGQSAFAGGFLADSRGDLYTAGSAYDESGFPNGHAIVRRIDSPAGVSTTVSATFSSTAITGTSEPDSDESPSLAEEILA